MLSYFQALILGIVEGITEFLPISSTGHLILTSELLGIADNEFIKSFDIIIQLGAILAVVVLYFRSLVFNFEILKRVVVGFIPTGIIGLTLYSLIKQFLGNSRIVLWSLLIGGIVLILFERFRKTDQVTAEDIQNISLKHSFIIGLFQTIAIIPGVSRSAATIIGGLLLKYPRKTIVEFSFLLAIPTMGASTGFELIKNASNFDPNQAVFLAIGFVTSFITALITVKWLLSFIKNHDFTSFGIYRVIIALLGFLLL